jgi:hypothetical protein
MNHSVAPAEAWRERRLGSSMEVELLSVTFVASLPSHCILIPAVCLWMWDVAHDMSEPFKYKAVRKAILALLEQPEYDDRSAGPVLVRLAW